MEFSVVAGKVHAFFRQFFRCIGNLLVYGFELVFCGGLSAGDVVRIPGFVGQSVNSSVFPVDFHFSGIDVSCRAVNSDFVAGFDDAGCSVDGYLFGRIGSQCDFVAESDSIFFAACSIGSFGDGYIAVFGFDGRMLACQCLYVMQLAAIDSIGAVCADVTGCYVGDFVAAVVKAVLGEGYRVSGRAVADGYSVIVDECIAGGYAFEAFQGFGKADFQVVAAIGYDAKVVFCGQFVFLCNAADDVHLFVQFLLDDCSCIAAVLHAVIQGSYFFIGAVRFLVYDTGRGRTRCTVHPGFAVTGNGDICRLAVFSVDADFSIFAVFTCGHDCFDFQVFIHLHVDCRISGRVLRNKGFKVFSTVIVVGSRAFPFNGDLGA